MVFLLLQCILLLVNLWSIPSASQPQEEFHLLQFRDSLPEASRLLLQWNRNQSVSSSAAHCHRPGVSCYGNQDGRIRTLNLTSLGLSGVLANSISDLCALHGLTSLDLSGNSFTGGVPAQLGNCSQLNTILLNDNSFSGAIPPQLFKSRRIRKLDLGYNQLIGTIPPEVGQCESLEYLGLYNNHLSGEIPAGLFSLPNLKFLYMSTNDLKGTLPDLPIKCLLSDLRLHENSFTGPLPLSLSNCHDLRILFASDNSLGGMMPHNFFKGLRRLEILYLSENNFEGVIPMSLWDLQNLQELVFTNNRLNGSIPEDISRCQRLTYLDLSGNNLTGPIPASLCSVGNLEYMFLYKNMLDGFIPPETGNCSSLIEFRVGYNRISGILPPEICGLRNLKVLHAFNNRIEGPIPDCIGRLTSLKELAIYENRLTGRIPSGISKLANLSFISLAHNNLTGKIPPELGKNSTPGLVKLDLTGNHLTGKIPSGICSERLRVLTLGDNLFAGSFPREIIKCKSLTRLILKTNLLQGSLPDDTEKTSNISYFDVSWNLLEGNIPAAFGSWSNLSMIDLSGNKFSGSIPPELGRLQNLQVLRISANRLTGEIPPLLAHCPRITEIDLSKNKLTGGLPSEIVSSSTLRIIRLQDNKLSGKIPNSFSSWQVLHELHLGNNMLEGCIPCGLSQVRHFSFLNLSMNRLSGGIPKCLGRLDKMEVLDISSNNLSGEIPSETDNMASLSFVNISFNYLSGSVPDGWAKIFASHNGSTFGNPRLCYSIAANNSNCEGHRKSHARRLILASIITLSVLFIASLIAVVYVVGLRIQNHQPSSPHQSLLHHQSGSGYLPDDLNFEDILRGTEGWSDKYVIGRGKHGTVYRTESMKSRKHWAVKKVDLTETKFSTEIRTLSMVRHRNVMRMGGYSMRGNYGFIVTEYMPEGTLYYVLHQKRPQVGMNREARYRIALGIAQGLSYLHNDCVPQIIHRDVKSDNILLDSDMEPKIGDFGAAKLDSDSDENSTVSVVVGTLGYIAPENAYSTKLTDKCDVYSYGVVLLELLCRKLPVDPSFDEGLDIVSWVRKSVQAYNDCFYCLDEEVKQWERDDDLQEALGMMDIALRCTEMFPNNRPSMRDVVASLLKFDFHRKSSVMRRDR